MMRTTLRILLGVLGASAVLIALSILLLGAGATAASGEAVFDALTGWRGQPSPRWPATMDNELRFYAALWGAYGLLLLRAAREPRLAVAWTPWLAATFFAGGVGRVLSWISVGPPHPFFLALMTIELATPPVLIGLWWAGVEQLEGGKRVPMKQEYSETDQAWSQMVANLAADALLDAKLIAPEAFQSAQDLIAMEIVVRLTMGDRPNSAISG